jgi:hypothetical protein
VKFAQDFLHAKWGDFCALLLVGIGVALSVWTKQGALGHDLVAAGLVSLRMTRTAAPNENGTPGGSGDLKHEP